MPRPRLLDLFCGAGGAAVGYHRAGFDVVGVDLSPQKDYPFEFVEEDALQCLSRMIEGGSWNYRWGSLDTFDAIHASPPCQAYSVTKHSHGREHPELVDPVRDLLNATTLPWVMENVVGAPLVEPLELCGSQFGLRARDRDGEILYLRRHRLFESNVFMFGPGVGCRCSEPRAEGLRCGGVYGGGQTDRASAWGARGGYTPSGKVRKELMGIDWMTDKALCQAIPPAYTEFIGQQLLAHLGAVVA